MASVQQGCHISGQHLWVAEPKAHSVPTVATHKSACTIRLLQWHQKHLNAGITARMRNPQRRCWLAPIPGLSGGAQLASTSGRRQSSCAPVVDPVVLSAVPKTGTRRVSPPLQKLSLPVWLSGTMTAIRKRGSSQTSLLLVATSWYTGSALAAPEGSHTAGQQCHSTASKTALVVRLVTASKLASATLWSRCFRPLQPNLMWTRMALLLLRLQPSPTRWCGGGMKPEAAGRAESTAVLSCDARGVVTLDSSLSQLSKFQLTFGCSCQLDSVTLHDSCTLHLIYKLHAGLRPEAHTCLDMQATFVLSRPWFCQFVSPELV